MFPEEAVETTDLCSREHEALLVFIMLECFILSWIFSLLRTGYCGDVREIGGVWSRWIGVECSRWKCLQANLPVVLSRESKGFTQAH